MKASAVRHLRIILTMKIACAVFVILIQALQCLASDDSPFQLTNRAAGFCLVKTNNDCSDIRWTTGDRLLVPQRKKCLGAQGKSVGSEINLYNCDETSELQRWECKNETVLALKDQELYIELSADNTAVLSTTVGPNNHLTISGTSNGACTRTFRELYAIGGNAAGMPCMFPFQYKDQWYSDCTLMDSSVKRLWCAVETKFQSERWGYCPVTSKEGWDRHPTMGVYYQLNTQSALTWYQAETSCKQQGASLLSVNDPHEQAYIIALLGRGGNTFWTGLILDPEHGWTWSNGNPYRYMKWDSGHPLPNPGHNCAIADPAVQYSWQSSPCSKKLGYICYSKAAEEQPTQAVETGFCSNPWIPYNGHCFYLNQTQKTWSDAQRECRNGGGDLVSIRNVEDQSFVISQLGYTSTDELWIGLNDRKTEGLFDWTDHSTVSFTSWEFGKPAVSTDIQDCVLIRGEKGNWADRSCEEKHGYICMKMSASNPTGDEVRQDVGCKTGWRRHGSYCYFIGTENKMFDDAKGDCQRSNSYLADVSNGVDNAFLVSLVGLRPEKHFWIGLSNQRDINEFVWTNTKLVGFTHWNAEMPGHRQGCVAMKTGIFSGLWDVLPCTNKEKYICKHLAEGASVTPVPPTPPSTTCAYNWDSSNSRNYCYKLFSEKRTWYEARDFCRAIGGDLVSFHSADEMRFARFISSSTTYWIGLSAPDPATGYVWSDGSPLQFQNWATGQPNNKNNVQSCTEIGLHGTFGGNWNDVNCEKYNKFMCQIQKGVTPNRPPEPVPPDYNRTSDGWIEWRGNQYFISRFPQDIEEARRYCQKKHSDLVTINSAAESLFLWKQMTKNTETHSRSGDYWIGLTVDLDRTYEWMDGSPVVFQSWDENQPRLLNNDEHCAVMTIGTGFWRAQNCGNDNTYICKRSSSRPANATVAPTVSSRGGCPQNWKKFNSKCYNIIYNQRETWDGARTKCKEMGGNLASILSRQVQVFLTIAMAEVPTTDVWIGLVSVNGNPFYWTDGRRMQYTNWDYQNDFRFYHHRNHFRLSQMEEMELLLRQRRCGMMTTNNTNIGKWARASCNDTKGYICLRNVDPSFPDSPEPTTANYVKVLNDSFKAVPQKLTWDAAKKHCEGDGAKLASLRNKWSTLYAELIASDLRSTLWIGMNTLETGGFYRYIDGWRLTTTNWNMNEPRRENPCVCVDTSGQWRSSDCDEKRSSICMKSTDVPPTEPSDFPGICPDDQYTAQREPSYSWLPFKGHCYLFITERVEWPHASTNCARYGGTLASIEDPSEQDFIQSNILIYGDSVTSFWIGLYKTRRGTWLWLDKTTLDYTNWGKSQSGSSSFAGIRSEDGKWISHNQWTHKAYICKTPKVLLQVPPTTAVTPAVDTQTGGHVLLTVGLVLTVIAIGAAIFLFVFKRSGGRLPIPKRSTTIDNPLFFNKEQSD